MPDVFCHRQALVESDEIGDGTRVWAFAHVMKGARVGRDCNIGDHAFIESGAVVGDRVTIKNQVQIWDKVVIGDDVFVGPGVVFTNDLVPRVKFRRGPGEWLPTVVSGGASIGANATIVCGTVIGRNAFIGAGSVVTTDVANHALVVGNPARWVGWVCECGLRLDGELTCRCGRTYEFDGSGLTST